MPELVLLCWLNNLLCCFDYKAARISLLDASTSLSSLLLLLNKTWRYVALSTRQAVSSTALFEGELPFALAEECFFRG